jgi:hypothetical protein
MTCPLNLAFPGVSNKITQTFTQVDRGVFNINANTASFNYTPNKPIELLEKFAPTANLCKKCSKCNKCAKDCTQCKSSCIKCTKRCSYDHMDECLNDITIIGGLTFLLYFLLIGK